MIGLLGRVIGSAQPCPCFLELASGWVPSQGDLSIWDREGRLKPVPGALWVRGTKCGLVQPGL